MTTSYKDQKWGELEAKAEARWGVPSGFLSDLRLKGERSNADQVSEAGAKSVWQIIPETRNLIKTKYKVDAYAGPEQAAEAAAIVVKDAFNWAKKRTKDPQEQKALAAGYYHAGGDTSNWGKKTDAYIRRVTGAAPEQQSTQKAQGRSLGAELNANKEQGSIATVYEAYKSGRMTPEDSAAFEEAVNGGSIMLPRGATVKASDSGIMSVVRAYSTGRMTPEDAQAFRSAVVSGAIKLPPNIALSEPGAGTSEIPVDNATPQASAQQPQQPEPSFLDKAVGAGEAALAMGTGMVGGSVGMLAGAVRGAGELIVNGGYGTPEGADVVQRNAIGAAQALTYQPRGQAGQQITQAIGKAVGDVLPPVLPMMAATGGAITQGVKASAPMAVAAGRRAAAPVVTAAQNVGQRVQQALPQRSPAFGNGSISAAQVEAGALRQAKADEIFGGDYKMTKGQRIRTQEQQRFEQETAKDPERGDPIRQRMAEQQKLVRQKLDQWVDDTGAEAPDDMRLRHVGNEVNNSIRSALASAKAKERILYKEAEKAGEMEAPVSTAPLIKFLSENDSFNAPELSGATLGVIEREIVRLGGATRVKGELVPGQLKLKDMELVRRGVNAAIKSKQDNPTNMATGVKAKEIIDGLTDGVGGDLYKRARTARMQRAKDFENVTIVSNLLGTKRGSTDRKIALEDVADEVIFSKSTSLDQLKHLGGVVLKKTPQGQQAWKEIQGAALAGLRDKAFKGITSGQDSAPVFNPKGFHDAVTALDKTGKLDYLFGKKGAENLRSMNEIAKDSFTAVPGAVNTSSTASVLSGALDLMISAGAGIPAPIATATRLGYKMKKDKAIKTRVDEALK